VAECAALPCKNFLIRFEQLRGLSFFCFWREISGKSQWLIPGPGHMAKRIRALLKAFIGLYLRRILIPQIASILFFYRFDQFYVSLSQNWLQN